MTRHLIATRYRQRGVALITALLVVAIAGVLAAELVWHTDLDLRRTEGLLNWQQAQEYGYLAEEMATVGVQQVIDQHKEAVYTREDDENLCSDTPPEFHVEAVSIIGRVCDMQGRFNLNNLVTPNGKKDELVVRQFRRLLEAVAGDYECEKEQRVRISANGIDIDTIVDATVDWIDPDSTPEGFNGAEDNYYTALVPAYHAANFWFTDPSELRAVRGVTAEVYAALSPYITALPVGSEHTKINLKTAPWPVLASLGDDVQPQNACAWTQQTDVSTDDFQGFIDHAMIPYIQEDSKYFQVQASVTVGTTRLDMYSLLERQQGQGMIVRLRAFRPIQAELAASKHESLTVKDGEVVKADE